MKFGLSDKVIKELQEVFDRHKNISKVLIFGSRAKGNFREGSDIDLAALGTGLDYKQLLQILTEIDDLELLYSVDLIDYYKTVNTPIGDHIDRVGQVFYQSA
jgi:predicted nucleotidyltransferase